MATTRDVPQYVVGAYMAAQSNIGNSLGYCMLDCMHLDGVCAAGSRNSYLGTCRIFCTSLRRSIIA